MGMIVNNLKDIWDKISELYNSIEGKILTEQIERVSKYADLQEHINNIVLSEQTITVIAREYLLSSRFVNFFGGLCRSGDRILGITQRSYNKDELATITTHGIVYVEANSVLSSIGSEVQPSGEGKAGPSLMPFQNIFILDVSTGAGSLVRVKL